MVTIKLFSSFILVFFMPGLIWSFAIFYESKKISWLLRAVFAFAFSIFSIPLIEFYLNRFFKLEINRTNIIVEIIIFSLIGLIIYFIRYLKINFRKAAFVLIFAFFFLTPSSSEATVLPFDYSSQKIIKVSGDNQIINIGENYGEVKTRVVDENNNFIAGIEVIFTLYDEQGKMTGSKYSTITDYDGYATFKPKATASDKYTVRAEISNGSYVVFNLNMKQKGTTWFLTWLTGLNPVWLLLLLIPVVIFLAMFFRRQKNQVFDIQTNEGIDNALITIEAADDPNIENLSSDKRGYFAYRFSSNHYRIKIIKKGFRLNSLDNHAEFHQTEDGWFYFEVIKRKEKLRFGMKRAQEEQSVI